MFMNVYFYWSGVVANGLVVFWVIVGSIIVVKSWWRDAKMKRKYAVKEIEKE